MAAGYCAQIAHCVNCRQAGCVVVGCKRDKDSCPCAPFHQERQEYPPGTKVGPVVPVTEAAIDLANIDDDDG